MRLRLREGPRGHRAESSGTRSQPRAPGHQQLEGAGRSPSAPSLCTSEVSTLDFRPRKGMEDTYMVAVCAAESWRPLRSRPSPLPAQHWVGDPWGPPAIPFSPRTS